MKTKIQSALCAHAVLVGLTANQSALAQGTAFSDQGRLNDGANLANGNYDLTFSVFDVKSVNRVNCRNVIATFADNRTIKSSLSSIQRPATTFDDCSNREFLNWKGHREKN